MLCMQPTGFFMHDPHEILLVADNSCEHLVVVIVSTFLSTSNMPDLPLPGGSVFGLQDKPIPMYLEPVWPWGFVVEDLILDSLKQSQRGRFVHDVLVNVVAYGLLTGIVGLPGFLETSEVKKSFDIQRFWGVCQKGWGMAAGFFWFVPCVAALQGYGLTKRIFQPIWSRN